MKRIADLEGKGKFICIHGHFYQPPRENPWLEEIEYQDSAAPYHDWNERITAQCYAPNLDSRILGTDGRITEITNNFAAISHDIGPTLMSWLEHRRPDLYHRLIRTDRESRARFSGHGPALAQAYNHTILPLATSRDKRLQILWGIQDFRHRYGRDPEGIWLPETAVDMESLEILSDLGIGFTILAPRQALRVRPLAGGEWADVSGERIDPRRPYLCRLPSGRSIALFFYDGPASRDIAFGQLLKSGERLTSRLLALFSDPQEEPQLVHAATDGETFGHHHPFTEMALSFTLRALERREDTAVTVYGEYLEKHPPAFEVEIRENSSWSCVHGVERWRGSCGCSTGGRPGWSQEWRGPLRRAMDWLNSRLSRFYEKEIGILSADPWALREDYIRLVLDRSTDNTEAFFQSHFPDSLNAGSRIQTLRLLEMQRACQLMFTSCGWFFDEISGIEPVQILKYAARAMQLAVNRGAEDPEPGFLEILAEAPSNLPRFKNGAAVYRKLVKPEVISLRDAAAHFAVSTVFAETGDVTSRAFFVTDTPLLRRHKGGRVLSAGSLHIRSLFTGEEESLDYAAHLSGGYHLSAGLAESLPPDKRKAMAEKLEEAFFPGRSQAVETQMDAFLGGHGYSIGRLFKDRRRAVMKNFTAGVQREIEEAHHKLFQRHYALLLEAKRMEVALPEGSRSLIAGVLSKRLREALETVPPDSGLLEGLITEMDRWGLTPDREKLAFTASRRMDEFFSRMDLDRSNPDLLRRAALYLSAVEGLKLTPPLWKPQILFFRMGEELGGAMKAGAEKGENEARDWLEAHRTIARILRIRDV